MDSKNNFLCVPAPLRENTAETLMLIREATDSDIAQIARLSAQLGYPAETAEIQTRIERTKDCSDYLLLVCENDSTDGQLLGWLQAHASTVLESGHRLDIVGLVVAKDARRNGVGGFLVARAEQWTESIGAKTMNVRSNIQRQEAHLFYPSLGYQLKKTQAAYRKDLAVVSISPAR